ncbi:MAG: S-layer homology domain-containing protein, partial [Oscillospiraceae bacterium]
VATTSANTFGGKLSSLPTPTRDGHTFDGWFTAASDGTKVTKETTFDKNTTIYAHWTASSGRGDYIPPVQTTVDSGKEVSAFDLDTLASEGKTLTVNGKNGEKLVLDAETVKALAKAGGNLVVTVGDAKGKLTPEQAAQAGNRPVYDLTAILNGKIVTNFDGKITVSLPYLLKEGENAEDVTVWYLATDGSMTEIPATYDPKTGLATFTVTHFSKYVVGVWLNPFTDVKEGAWYFDAVKYVHKNGMFSGVSATIFAPNASTTRAMLWSVLARQAGQDTTGGANWYEKAQAWAIAKGVSDGTNPTGDVTREQLVTMLWRYSGSPTATADLSKFTDADSVSAYAKQAMAWAVEKGIVSGTTATTLSPKSNAARAQLA